MTIFIIRLIIYICKKYIKYKFIDTINYYICNALIELNRIILNIELLKIIIFL